MLLLGAALTLGYAQTPPGAATISYDSESQVPLTKLGYASNGVGWGVRFDPWTSDCGERWVEVSMVHVRLCPPPMDGYYQAKVWIMPAKSNGQPDFANKWESDPFDVRVGAWWHDIPVTKPGGLFYPYSKKVFAFVIAVNGFQSLYQWFDVAKDAPASTQWYYNGATFSQYSNPGVGDIMIRLDIKKHDFGVTRIERPTSGSFVPRAWVKNYTGFAEQDVPVRFWVKNRSTGQIVYDQTVLWDAGQEFAPVEHSLSFPSTHLARGSYTAYCATQYHGSAGDGYPFRYERNTDNDQKSLGFTISSGDYDTPSGKKSVSE
jgi:hypothetical protein